MINIMTYETSFFETVKKNKGKIIIYGAGTAGKMAISFIENIYCFCDKRAKIINKYCGIEVISPNQLEEIKDTLNIIICIGKNEEKIEQVIKELSVYHIDANIFNLYDSYDFLLEKKDYRYSVNYMKEPFKVHLVNYDKGWICTKFAERMNENLLKNGIKSDISDIRERGAEINHHIPYHNFRALCSCNDTMMVTHVDTYWKMELIKNQLVNARMAICMSKETMNMLITNGVPHTKVCYINPAHDDVIQPKKYVLGITHKNHDAIDFRKNIQVLLEICKEINPQYFKFRIMGEGWDEIVFEMRKMGFLVDYYNEFQYEKYTDLIESLDYYLFFGYDEGSMGYLDALSAGVKTIVTPQGYHLDVQNGITFPCEIVQHFINTLQQLENERKILVNSVSDLTWENYTNKHLELWYYLTQRKELKELLKNKHKYNDGIFSTLLNDITTN